jgi:hypothetical protein
MLSQTFRRTIRRAFWHGYYDTTLISSELEDAGFSRMVIETRAEQSRAPSPRFPAAEADFLA